MFSTRSDSVQIDQCLTFAIQFCIYIFSLYFNIVNLIYEVHACVWVESVASGLGRHLRELGDRRHEEALFHPDPAITFTLRWSTKQRLCEERFKSVQSILLSISRVFFVLQSDWSARDARGDFSAISLNEDVNTLTTPPEVLWESLHEHFTIWLITYTHRTVKVFTATRQSKSLVKLGRHCAKNILILFSRMYYCYY